MMADGAVIIDARDSAAFGGFHIPGSINIGFEKQLANWVGMVVDPKAEIILVVDDRGLRPHGHRTAPHRLRSDLRLSLRGDHGLADERAGGGTTGTDLPQQLKSQLEKSNIRIIDVRTPAEWDGGRIKWAEHFPLSDILEDHFPQAEKRTKNWCCSAAAGTAPNIAASIMKQAGYQRQFICWRAASLPGPMPAWKQPRRSF
jgi:hydroxyacylglutathione hydrolase